MNNVLYKYLPKERIDDVLEGQCIRFSQIAALNDPNEGLSFLLPAMPEGFHLNPLYVLENEMNKALSREASHQPKENLDFSRDLLQRILKFCQKYKRNPLELEVAKMAIECLGLDKNNGILSLSPNPKNLLMWAHYAVSHKGFVVGLDMQSAFKKRGQQTGVNFEPQNVVYRSYRERLTLNFGENFGLIFLRKSVDWAYEEEIRLLARLEDPLRKCKEDDGQPRLDDRHCEIWAYDFPPEAIVEICLGLNICQENRTKIFEIRNRRYPNAVIKQATLADSEDYDIHFFECDVNGGRKA